MQNYANLCKIMQIYAKLCKCMLIYSKLISCLHFHNAKRLGGRRQTLGGQRCQAVLRIQRNDADRVVRQTYGQKASAELSHGHRGQRHAHYVRAHFFALRVLVELSARVHFEVDEFAARQSDHYLPLIDGTLDNKLFGGRFPLVDTLVGAYVANAFRVDLYERILAQLRAAQSGHGAQEARVGDFFDGFADAQHQSGVQKRHDNV